MNPFRAFRILGDIARRRPFLVGLVGLGLLAEAARVGEVLLFGGTVTIFGHSGAEEWRTADGEPWIAAYVAWVGACGLVVIGLAILGRRRSRAGAVASPEDVVRAPEPAPASPPASVATQETLPRPARISVRAASPTSPSTPKRAVEPVSAKLPARPAGGAVVWRRGVDEKRPVRRGP